MGGILVLLLGGVEKVTAEDIRLCGDINVCVVGAMGGVNGSNSTTPDVYREGKLEPHYQSYNDQDLTKAKITLKQILAQDPRSSHKRGTVSSSSNSSNTTNSDYQLIFGRLQVQFSVNKDGITIVTIAPIDFDSNAYVDGISLHDETVVNQNTD